MKQKDTINKPDLREIARKVSKEVIKDGWIQYSVGETSNLNFNFWFDLYIRRRKLADETRQNGDISKKSPNRAENENPTNTDKNGVSEASKTMVSKESMGNPKEGLTPSVLAGVTNGSENLPPLSHFDECQSLRAIRNDSPALVISFDSEWFYFDIGKTQRCLLTWQFSVIDGEDLVEFIFVRKSYNHGLSFELAVGRILDYLRFKPFDSRTVLRHEALTDWNEKTDKYESTIFDTYREAKAASKYPFPKGERVRTITDWSSKTHIPVVLLCHAGLGDLSGLDQSRKYSKNILKIGTEVQGGIISLRPSKAYIHSVNPSYAKGRHTHTYPVLLRLADTMCHAPVGMQSLKALGQVVGWEKVRLDDGIIERMGQFLDDNPRQYFAYAANDSTVTLLYESALYGYNNRPAVTVTSATSNVMRRYMMTYLGCQNTKEFNRIYRGLMTVGTGLVPKNNLPGYVESTDLKPISDKANAVQYYASQAYHGGYNSCSDAGYFPNVTFDYDLQNAYPTAMCLVMDVDWENPIRFSIINRYLSLQDFSDPATGGYVPISMMFCYVRFEFPKNVKYPCIPVNVNGVPIFPRTSEGLDGVYACGPELYLALRLGAKVFVENGYVLNGIIDKDSGKTSYSLRAAVHQLVADRNKAKNIYGKKSLEQQLLKIMVNSGYGKISQNVVQKQTWSAYSETMEALGCSAITNPAAACMITSIVRAVLLAAQNQCDLLGYMTCSVTTDGFIADIPKDILKSLDLYDLLPFMEEARLYLTDGDSSELWEIKHCQDDLVNFTTRGNASLYSTTNPMQYSDKEYEGVCAHNNTKSGYYSDSYEDRLWLITHVLNRTTTVDYECDELPNLKEVIQGHEYSVTKGVRHIRMDFDMKRKPDRDSFFENTVNVEGKTYVIANFETIPFESVEEFLFYRQKKDCVPCLRTMEDWRTFWFKVDTKGVDIKVRDMDWAILNSCVIGHRAGFWTIPKLNELSGADRDAWLNAHNTSKKTWKPSDWKNAGRNSRQFNLIPRELLQKKLDELMND